MIGDLRRVHIEDDFQRDGHNVYVIVEGAHGQRGVLQGDGNITPVTEGVAFYEPSLKLPHGGLDALVQAAAGAAPPHPATQEALEDTRGVRDRLLGLVEMLAIPHEPIVENVAVRRD